jgi:hypothetical protein
MPNNEDASAGGIIALVGVFLLAGVLFVAIGFGIDRFTLMAFRMFTNTASSQIRFDTVNLQLMIFRAEPFILLLFAGLNYWVTEIRQYSGTIPLGTMLMNAAEMIILSLVTILFTLFGGYALDMTMSFVNGWNVAGVDLDMTLAAQYGGMLFYGVMFLAMIGVILQFCIAAVQITDYSQSYSY